MAISTNTRKSGILKAKRSRTITPQKKPLYEQSSPPTPHPYAADLGNQIHLRIHGTEELSLSGQLDQFKNIFESLQQMDDFILSCSDIAIKSVHRIDQSSTFKEPKINIFFELSNNSPDIHNIIYAYLDKCRRAICCCDYCSPDYFDDLIRVITELSIEFDEQANQNSYLCHVKSINRIKLAKVIEKMSLVKSNCTTKWVFDVHSAAGDYAFKTIEKRRAIDLLGGKYMDDKLVTGNFIVNKLTFEDIESRLEFMLDGNSVHVFIVDKQWVSKFNNHEIAIAKSDRIKAKTKIERSPLNIKIAAYYFVQILGVNI